LSLCNWNAKIQKMNNIATRTTQGNTPIDNPKRIDILLYFTEAQFLQLSHGLIASVTDDRWFIFYEDDWLYFHRSWTGYGTYKAQLIKKEDGYYVKDFWAERNKEKFKNEDDNRDIQTFSILVAEFLLGIDVKSLTPPKS